MSTKEEYSEWYAMQVQELFTTRMQKEVSQVELAEAIGFSPRTIVNIENFNTHNYKVVWCGLRYLENLTT